MGLFFCVKVFLLYLSIVDNTKTILMEMREMREMEDYLQQTPLWSELLMSAATYSKATKKCRYTSEGDPYSKYDGVVLKGNKKTYLELKHRGKKYNMSFFKSNPPLIELNKYLYLKKLERSFYVNFISEGEKTYLVSWDLKREDIFVTMTPQTKYHKKTSQFNDNSYIEKQVMHLDIDKAHRLDITEKLYNNLPGLIRDVYNAEQKKKKK